MNQIRMNASELEACAAQLDRCTEEFYATIANVRSIVLDRMPTCWEGRAVAAYGEQYESLEPSFHKMVDCCEKITSHARQVCQNFRDVDEGMARSMGVI